MHSGWSPPLSFARKAAPGLAAAKQRALRRRGWRVAAIPMGQLLPVAGRGQEAALQRVLLALLDEQG